jgi:FkbM family methyltransferase
VNEISNRLTNERGMVLDIGAHVGSHTVALAKLKPDLRFICFEPQRPLFSLLERNIHQNGLCDRVQAFNAAVGHAPVAYGLSSKIIVEELNTHEPVRYGSGSPLNLGGMQLGSGGQQCQIVRVDDLDLPPVRYIKIDVEGAEPLAFHGMQRLLARDLPLILFEDRDDRRLSSETLDALCVPVEIREFSPRRHLVSLGYHVEKLGLDYIARPPSARGRPRIPAHADIHDTIPACIFQTWKSKVEFPPNFSYWLSTFDTLNPSFEHIIWDDEDNRNFIASHFEWFLPSYDTYPREIYRADAVRYFFLYTFGGLYADTDVECLRAFDGLIAGGDLLLGRMGNDPDHPHSIPNAIMASKPKQEFWLFVMWLLMETAKQKGLPEFITGPVLLKSAVDLYLARDPQWVSSVIQGMIRRLPPELHPEKKSSNIHILPSREWFAVDWTDPIHQRLRRQVLNGALLSEEEKKELFPHSSMVTYWTHSH